VIFTSWPYRHGHGDDSLCRCIDLGFPFSQPRRGGSNLNCSGDRVGSLSIRKFHPRTRRQSVGGKQNEPDQGGRGSNLAEEPRIIPAQWRRGHLGHMLNHTIERKAAIGIMMPKITAPTTSKRSPMIPICALATPKGLAASWAALDELRSATG
jgi:hypothetical protein